MFLEISSQQFSWYKRGHSQSEILTRNDENLMTTVNNNVDWNFNFVERRWVRAHDKDFKASSRLKSVTKRPQGSSQVIFTPQSFNRNWIISKFLILLKGSGTQNEERCLLRLLSSLVSFKENYWLKKPNKITSRRQRHYNIGRRRTSQAWAVNWERQQFVPSNDQRWLELALVWGSWRFVADIALRWHSWRLVIFSDAVFSPTFAEHHNSCHAFFSLQVGRASIRRGDLGWKINRRCLPMKLSAQINLCAAARASEETMNNLALVRGAAASETGRHESSHVRPTLSKRTTF